MLDGVDDVVPEGEPLEGCVPEAGVVPVEGIAPMESKRMPGGPVASAAGLHDYDEKVADIFIQKIREGLPLEVAASCAGVSVPCVRNWLSLGKYHAHTSYSVLTSRYIKAKSDAEAELVGYVRSAAAKDARHAQWLLERMAPERWGKDAGELKKLRRRLRELRDEVETLREGQAPLPSLGDVSIPTVSSGYLLGEEPVIEDAEVVGPGGESAPSGPTAVGREGADGQCGDSGGPGDGPAGCEPPADRDPGA